MTAATSTRAGPPWRLQNTVLLCHFLAAFTALGMPLFLPRMLADIAPHAPDVTVGLLFALPILCTASSAVAWGRFADRFGKRTSLLRAQLGLALGFLVSGCADSLPVFAAGLALQGLCGGTLAASNAYLSDHLRGDALAQSLNLTQVSARLALLLGPLVLGLFTQIAEPLSVYRYLALLPLLAWGLTLALPRDRAADSRAPATSKRAPLPKGTAGPLRQIFALQFLFCGALVMTFPYFLHYTEALGVVRDSVAGGLYSLPHLVYLAGALALPKVPGSPSAQVRWGLTLLVLSCALQACLASVWQLVLARLLFGLAMLLSYHGLHRLLSQQVQHRGAGALFGRFDAYGKWAGVCAGFAAGLCITLADQRSPFIAAAICAAVGVCLLRKKIKEDGPC